MARLYGRAASLVIGSQLIEGLRVSFKAKKSIKKEPNDCEIQVYNLSEHSRAALQSKGTKIILEAGYEGDTSQVFAGDSRIIDHVHEGPDWITKVQCGDGERAYRYARIVESFAPGTPVADVFAKVAAATGLDVIDAVATVRAFLPGAQYTQGYTAYGRASSELDCILKGRGLEWSIQDGRLQVLSETGTTKDTATLLSAETGLIGSPAHGSPDTGNTPGKPAKKPQVLKVKCLLNPRIKPGGRVVVQAEAIKGTFKVQTLTHSGDTHGAEWYSELECVPV